MKRFPAGRLNDAPSIGLSASLNSAGFKLGRLQTGTPARLDGTTINFTGLARQEGDAIPSPFSYMNREVDNAVRFSRILLIYHLAKMCYNRRIKFLVFKQSPLLQHTKSSKAISILVFTSRKPRKVSLKLFPMGSKHLETIFID